ncbi:unnamed protein product [Adineta steineri]|uniref:N-acetylgalactosaminide beta-1,3-galactosyltransferase n=1 Tax=Adineta steineri TaxID=433720 RepID=A0A814F8N5_9BILA|nr:unnamed protein product [Adineta steineri]CAF1097824.1 unnamed protein product [Adineta steineri]
MSSARTCNLCILLVCGCFGFIISFVGIWHYSYGMWKTTNGSHIIIKHDFNGTVSPFPLFSSTPPTSNLPNRWTDSDYQLWKQEKYFPPNKPRGSIVYMVMTGDRNLRSRGDVMMCTFGMTLHPSRLFFVGEASSDRRLPVYDVVPRLTRRPVDYTGSMQKLAQGLALVTNKINNGSYKNEINWIMVMDDDTFVTPQNLEPLASEHDHRRSLMIGTATCGVGFCGGAGYLISRALFDQFPKFIKKCRPIPGYPQSDQFVPACIKRKTQVEFITRPEFHSQPPAVYSSEEKPQDHPDSLARAVTFHFVKPAENYISLWELQQTHINGRVNKINLHT